MRIPVLEVPERVEDFAGWLEEQLVDPDLRFLIAELCAIHGSAATPEPSLKAVLEDRHARLRIEGLAALDAGQLQTLLTHPALLLELQEDVLAHGGDHWERILERSTFDSAIVETGWAGVEQVVLNEAGMVSATTARPLKLSWYRRSWLVSLVAAAVVLIAVSLIEQFGTASRTPSVVGWGWDRPGALPQDVPADVYFERLAEAAEEWFNKRPEAPPALARRILEFRQGCSALILSPHEPLPDEDRAWLVDRCRAWAAKLDAHLTALEAGEDVPTVRAAADETVRNLVEALRHRAEQVG